MPKVSRLTAIAVVVVVCFAAYSNALLNEFTLDDAVLALRNPWIRDPGSIPAIFTSAIWSFDSEFPQNYYRPMLHLIYMADYHIFTIKPWGYHLTKILFHTGSSVLVYLIASVITRGRGQAPARAPWSATPPAAPAPPAAGAVNTAFVAALLFALHPINTDSVLNGITELSFAFFALLSFYFYIEREEPRIKLSAFFFLLSALCKETALVLPALIITYDLSVRTYDPPVRSYYFSFKGRKAFNRAFNKRYLPFLAATGVYLALRSYALGGLLPSEGHADLGVWGRFINVFPLFALQLEKLLLPVGLNAAYTFHPISSILEWRALAGLGAVAGFALALWLLYGRSRRAFFCLIWIAVPLVPALYLPALGEHAFAERYLYLSSAGFALLISMGLGALALAGIGQKRRWGAAVVTLMVILITVLYSAGTLKRVPVWRDDLTIWTDTATKSPGAHTVHINLGSAYAKRDMIDEAEDEFKKALALYPYGHVAHNNLGSVYYTKGLLDEAIEEYKKALVLYPDYVETHINIGVAYGRQGRTTEAVRKFKEALRLKPGFQETHFNLGNAYYELGLVEKSIEAYKKALEINPNYLEARINLGVNYAALGRQDEAVTEYLRALGLRPDFPETHYILGNAYYELGLVDQSIEAYKTAIDLDPAHAEAHNNLGGVYYGLGRIDEATGEYKTALRLNPGYVEAHYNLGSAYASEGLIDEAIGEFREAVRLAPERAEGHFYLAAAYREKGMRDEAISEIERGLTINPGDETARKVLETLKKE